MRRLPIAFVLAAACGGGESERADAPRTIDAPRVIDASTADAAPCPTLDACSWLEPYEREIVGKLAGEREIAAGVTLEARASRADRTIARTFLMEELVRLGYTPMQHAYAASGANVIAILPATSGPADAGLVVLGAHFDGVAVGPAAADNATGTALVMAAARWLPTLTERTHPVAIALFDEEENGLVGSRAWAMQLVDDATPVHAVHSFDMISWDADGDRAVELWSPTASLEAEYRLVAGPAGIPIQPVPFQYSDHQAFLEQGFTTVGVSEEYVGNDYTPHYHQPTDTYDKVNFTHLARVTRLALTVVAAELAAE